MKVKKGNLITIFLTLATAPPTYAPNEPVLPSARVCSEGVMAWSESLQLEGASSQASQDSDTVFESSLADMVSIAESSAEMTTPLGPRYGELSSYYYRSSLEIVNLLQFTTEHTAWMDQFKRRILSIAMIRIWDISQPNISRLLTQL